MVQSLRNDLRQITLDKESLEDQLAQAQRHIENRDSEIQRLNNLYEGGQNLGRLNIEHVSRTNQETLQKLQDQADFVNRENKRLEGALAKANSQLSEVDKFIKDRKNMSLNLMAAEDKNKLLQAQIKQMDTVVRQLKEEKSENSDPNIGPRMVLASDLEKEQRAASDLKEKIEELNGEIRVLKTQIGDAESVQAAYSSDKHAFNQHASTLKEANDTLREEHEKLRVRLHMVEKEKGIL